MSSPTPTDAQIAEAAYFLWIEDGCPDGKDTQHWAAASAALSIAEEEPKPKRKPAKKAAPTKAPAKAKAKADAKEKPKARPRKTKAAKAEG